MDKKAKVKSLIQTPYCHHLLSFAKGTQFFYRGVQYFRFDFVELVNRQAIFRIDQIYYKPTILFTDRKEDMKLNAENNRPIPVFMGLRFTVDIKKQLLIGTGTSVECLVKDIVRKVQVVLDDSKVPKGAFKIHAERTYKSGPLQKYRHPEVHYCQILYV